MKPTISRDRVQTDTADRDEKFGGVELLPPTLRGLESHHDQIQGVLRVRDAGHEFWRIFFAGAAMPLGYWYNVGDKWEITNCGVRKHPRHRLLPTWLLPERHLHIVVQERQHD